MKIYKITNQLNGNFYIGKTNRSLERRFYEHTLGYNKEKMPIAKAIEKYGKENFKIECLYEVKTEEELNNLEKQIIEKLNPAYNVSPGGNGGALFTGRKHSENTKQILRQLKTGRKDSKETIEKKRLAKIGKKQSIETVRKKVESQAKVYIFFSPENKKITIKNLNEYCRNNNLTSSAMRAVYYGKRNIHKGYRRII